MRPRLNYPSGIVVSGCDEGKRTRYPPADPAKRCVVDCAHLGATARVGVPVAEIVEIARAPLEGTLQLLLLPAVIRDEGVPAMEGPVPWPDDICDDAVPAIAPAQQHPTCLERSKILSRGDKEPLNGGG